jgi:hypothetical protein
MPSGPPNRLHGPSCAEEISTARGTFADRADPAWFERVGGASPPRGRPTRPPQTDGCPFVRGPEGDP